MIAHIGLNNEIQPLDKRPLDHGVGNKQHCLLQSATIKVRRRNRGEGPSANSLVMNGGHILSAALSYKMMVWVLVLRAKVRTHFAHS